MITDTRKTKKDCDERRLMNIKAFSSLDRKGLSFDGIQRRLLLKEFSTGEKVFIQYPGKESFITTATRQAKPWDFRPKLLKPDGTWLLDLSFKNIWDDLYELKDSNIDMSEIAELFFRMAFMIDSEEVTKTLSYEDVDKDDNVVNSGEAQLTWYEYQPDVRLFNNVFTTVPKLRGIALLPYLAVNDYLVQNEDCKYYYRDTVERNEVWKKSGTGRVNTMLTHMSVIAFIEGHLSFTEIMGMFQSGFGVAALPSKLWEVTTNGRIKKE